MIPHWIAGEPVVGSGGSVASIYNPATGLAASQVTLGTASDVDTAVRAAEVAFPSWRDTSLARRQRLMFGFRQLLDARKGELAEIVTAEHGKTIGEAAGEIGRGLDVVEFACGIPHLLKGDFTEGASTGVDVHSVRQPLGVVGVISPFNFPVMVPLWFVPIALACGNTVVLKPSERDPSAAVWMARLWAEAGLPEGVLNVVHGEKAAVNRLLEHPSVRAVSFVGSTPVARHVYETAAHNGKRVQALGGAKNHMVVMPDADLDLAADAVARSAFGAAGERCMAVSVVIAVEPIADELVGRIKQRALAMRTGDGTRSNDMGPLITDEHRSRVIGYIESGITQGAKLIVDGREVQPDGAEGGFWLGPTLFDQVKPDMSIYDDEIFGPVAAVVRVDTFEAGLELVNSHPYGNGAAVFTRDGGIARQFERDVRAGMVGINVPIPVPVAYYPFGGWKNSLFGDSHAYGTEGVRFFTQGKVVTTRWPDDTSAHGERMAG